MKKIILAVLSLVLLCSCSIDKAVVPKITSTSFSAKMTYYNESYSFDGRFSEDGVLYAELTSPEELEDLKMTISREGTTVEYKGIVYTPIESTMPFSSIIEDFFLAVSSVIDLKEEAKADSNGQLKLGSGAEQVVLTMSPTGLIQKIEMPDERFSVTFYNVKIEQES